MNINVCLLKLTNIRVEQGFCGICYQVCDVPSTFTALNKFLLSNEFGAVSVVDLLCLTDFIQIPCATDQQSSSQFVPSNNFGCISKICGAAFSVNIGDATPIPIYSAYFMPHFIITSVGAYLKLVRF